MPDKAKYVLRFFFEWGGGCLWSGSEITTQEFGYGPLDVVPTRLPLSARVIRQCVDMARWYDASLNWSYPPDPGPWRQPECDRFNVAVKQLLADIRCDLGQQFEVIDEQPELAEDKDLDLYLANPKGFRRNHDPAT